MRKHDMVSFSSGKKKKQLIGPFKSFVCLFLTFIFLPGFYWLLLTGEKSKPIQFHIAQLCTIIYKITSFHYFFSVICNTNRNARVIWLIYLYKKEIDVL